MTGRLVTRAEWGARPARGAIGNINPEGVTVHYNGPAFGGFPWDHGRCAQMVRGTQAFHLDGRGWADIAYTAMVCPHGFVFEGRGVRQRTAAQGTNDGNRRSLALMFLAGDGEPITEEARAAALWWANEVARVPLRWAHRDWHSTACPGGTLAVWKAAGFPPPGLEGAAPTAPPPPPPPPTVTTPPPPALPVRATLRRGNRGRDVGILQLEMSAVAGFTGAVDGDYGPATEAKVRDVQRLFKLGEDGIAGPRTRAVLDLLWLGKFGSVPT
jgi:hypothetical protein